MHRDGWKSVLVWVGLSGALWGVIATYGRDGSGSRTAAPPGHEARACGACGAHPTSGGPALPYELGDDNIRFVFPFPSLSGPLTDHR